MDVGNIWNGNFLFKFCVLGLLKDRKKVSIFDIVKIVIRCACATKNKAISLFFSWEAKLLFEACQIKLKHKLLLQKFTIMISIQSCCSLSSSVKQQQQKFCNEMEKCRFV